MAVSLRLIPGGTIRWRERRFIVVDYAGMDAIVARVVGRASTHPSQRGSNGQTPGCSGVRDASQFDAIHFHCDYVHFPAVRRQRLPTVTSISNDQRRPVPDATWQATVYHGLPRTLFAYRERSEGYVAFLSRMSPEKGVVRAIEIARRCGVPLKIAAKIYPEEQLYFDRIIAPLLDTSRPLVGYLGQRPLDYWMSLWRFLLKRDWQVEVFNPVLSSKSAQLRGRKTDADEKHLRFRGLRQRVIPRRLRAPQGGFGKLLPVAAFRRDTAALPESSSRSSENFLDFLQVRTNCPYTPLGRALQERRGWKERQNQTRRNGTKVIVEGQERPSGDLACLPPSEIFRSSRGRSEQQIQCFQPGDLPAQRGRRPSRNRRDLLAGSPHWYRQLHDTDRAPAWAHPGGHWP